MENVNEKSGNQNEKKLEMAMYLLSKQFCVIPDEAKGKRPLIGWEEFQARLSTKDEVAQWFQQWPDANLGVVTGKISNLVVVDIDGIVGRRNAKLLDLPRTVTVKSGRGRHLWFLHPGSHVPTKAKIIDGIDIRGDGGQIVGPGSIHANGKSYRWVRGYSPDECAIAPLPISILQLLGRTQTASPLPYEELYRTNVKQFKKKATGVQAKGLCPFHPDTNPSFSMNLQDGRWLCFGCNKSGSAESFIEQLSGSEGSPQRAQVGLTYTPTPLADFLAAGSATITWLVDGIIPTQSVSILAAPAGYGKTFMLLDLAIECSRGGKWLGQFPVCAGAVLYIDEESADVLVRSRCNKLLAAKICVPGKIDVHSLMGQDLRLTDRLSAQALRDAIERLRPKLVIIDSLIRVHGADENSSTEMAKVFAVVRKLARDFDCAILFADHQRKIGNFVVSPDQMLRGSTDKSAAVDTLLCIHKTDGHLVVDHAKSRFAEPVPSFVIEITDDANKTTTTVKYVGEAEPIKQASKINGSCALILNILNQGGWIARKDIVEQAKTGGFSDKIVDEALKTMVAQGSVEREDRKPQSGKGGKTAFHRLKGSLSLGLTAPNTPSPSPTVYEEKSETGSYDSLEVDDSGDGMISLPVAEGRE